MCGIVGFVNFKNTLKLHDLKVANSKIAHRGPDDEGYYYSDEDSSSILVGDDSNNYCKEKYQNIENRYSISPKIGIAHRRFSIINTSHQGFQPMISENQEYILVFNGEIFNYLELKEELKDSYSFTTNTDTEVILAAYKKWGDECFSKFNGFWSICIVDRKKEKVILSKDRFNQKQLHYIITEDYIFFSSEIKPLLHHLTNRSIDYEAAQLYLAYDRRDTLKPSLFKSINNLEGGTLLKICLINNKLSHKTYYSLPKPGTLELSEREILQELDNKLYNAVKIRLRSDVPLEANLSGGLDSSAIVAYASKLLGENKLTTHTFDYSNTKSLSESLPAKQIADYCKAKHSTIIFNPNEIWSSLDNYVKIIEEPVHSMAPFVQWEGWHRIAQEGYKVVLHGSANDELMMGYSYLTQIQDIYNIKHLRLPSAIQSKSIFHPKNLGRIVKWGLKGYYFNNWNKPSYNKKIYRSDFIDSTKIVENEILNLLKSSNGDSRRYNDFQKLRIPYWNNAMDKSMMSIPVEVRFPFLDYELVDFAMQVPSSMHYKNGWSKYLLRKLLDGKIPNEITWKKDKVGFSVPKNDWINNTSLLLNDRIFENQAVQQIYNIDALRSQWDHLEINQKWRIINFAIWSELFELNNLN